MARLLVLGAGRGQVPLIKAAKSYGHTTVVASSEGAYPGFDVADECYVVNITDPEAVADIVRGESFDAVITCCMDTGMETLGVLCERFGFIGPGIKAAGTARDKSLMKECFIKAGVRTAPYRKVCSKEELSRCAEELRYPLILKAVDQQGSRGVVTVRTSEDLESAYETVMTETRRSYCLVEEFITGEKHGANGCLVNGELLFLLPTEDLTDGNAVMGHIVPFEVEQSVKQDIYEQSLAAVKAVGLDQCVFNVDYIVKDGQAYIIEVTGRLGANGIPELLSRYYDTDIYKLMIAIALGQDITEIIPKYAVTDGIPCASKMIGLDRSGVLASIKETFSQDESVEVTYFVSPGQHVSRYRSAVDCVGQIIVSARSVDECKKRLEEIETCIEWIMED